MTVGQDQVLGKELCSSVPGEGDAIRAVRAGGTTQEAVRKQAGDGTK